MSNDTPRKDQDTTHQQELERLLNELKSVTNPIAKAVRKKFNGNESDIHLARLEAMEHLNNVIEQISPTEKNRGPQAFTPVDLVGSYWDQIKRRKGSTTTGFAHLNRVLEGGFEEDRLVVVLGAPGSGKTSLTNHMATHIAESEHPVLYVTSEDTPSTLLAKTISRRAKIPYSAVRHGYDSFRDTINAAHASYLQMPSAEFLRYVDATQGISLDGIYEQALEHFTRLKDRSKGTPLIVVDYLQRLSRVENLGVDARQSTTIFVERLRAMACDLHCTVVLLSAMNRASGYTAGNNTISSAKESGDIEYTADVIMALGPDADVDEVRPGVRRWLLRVDKNRQGDTTYDGKHITLEWCGGLQTFTEPDDDDMARKSDPVEGEAPAATSRNGRTSRRRG